MKFIQNKKWAIIWAGLLLSSILMLNGCTNLTPVDPLPSVPDKTLTESKDVKVVYNYDDTSTVQLSANNIALKVGQKLILEPAPGLTKNTRFTSSNENFFGDVMKQETDKQDNSKVVFTAIKPGKGKLQVIPNTDELDRAVELWVTVE